MSQHISHSRELLSTSPCMKAKPFVAMHITIQSCSTHHAAKSRSREAQHLMHRHLPLVMCMEWIVDVCAVLPEEPRTKEGEAPIDIGHHGGLVNQVLQGPPLGTSAAEQPAGSQQAVEFNTTRMGVWSGPGFDSLCDKVGLSVRCKWNSTKDFPL